MPYYKRKGGQWMVPWSEYVDMELVSISEFDKQNGSPKKGDMIAKNGDDRWLVSKQYFEENYYDS